MTKTPRSAEEIREIARCILEVRAPLFLASYAQDLKDLCDYVLSEAQQGAWPSEDEIRDYFQWSKDVKVTTPLQALEVIAWLKSRQPRAVSEMTPKQQNDAFVEALKTAKMGVTRKYYTGEEIAKIKLEYAERVLSENAALKEKLAIAIAAMNLAFQQTPDEATEDILREALAKLKET